MKPVDCHCHLDFDRFDEDRNEVIATAKEKLEFVVSVGCNFEKNRKTLEIAREHPEFVKPNLGLHPTYTDHFKILEGVKRQIRKHKPVGIGEIGLDHYHVKSEGMRKKQKRIFRQMLSLAEETGRPVNVHSRDAEKEVIEILKEYNLSGVLVHCFNGETEQAREAAGEGFKLGVTTQVLYSSQVKKIVKSLSLEDIVVETDSPFLYQGERNEPVNVLEAAEKIADIKDVSKNEVIEYSSSNAREIFGNR